MKRFPLEQEEGHEDQQSREKMHQHSEESLIGAQCGSYTCLNAVTSRIVMMPRESECGRGSEALRWQSPANV